MFYIGLKGGLGNQLFQYAFGVAASMESNIPLSIDITYYENTANRDTKRLPLLHHFHIQTPFALNGEVAKFHTFPANLKRKITRRLKPQSDYTYNSQLLNVKEGQYIEGWFQSEKYFKKYADTIRHELQLKEKPGVEATEALNEIINIKSKGIIPVLIHIRRGDYISNPHAAAFHGVMNIEYFKKALDAIEERVAGKKHIFYTTDDIEWVKANIQFPYESSFISRQGIQDYEEIHIMKECDHFIISNSSFSWWPAWLSENPNKIVIAPKNWVKDPSINTQDVCPEDWIRI